MAGHLVIEGVHGILVEEFELDRADLTPQADLYNDLGLDSLDTVDLAVAMEKQFGFKVDRAVDEKVIREMRTLEEVYAFVRDKVGPGGEQ